VGIKLPLKGGNSTPTFQPYGQTVPLSATAEQLFNLRSTDRPRPRRLCVRWGPRSPSPKRGEAHKFSAHVYCGQTAGWIKMVLGMDVGLSPGDFRWGPSPPRPKGGGAPSPIFGPFLLWPNGWMHQDVTWYGCRSQPRRHDLKLLVFGLHTSDSRSDPITNLTLWLVLATS